MVQDDDTPKTGDKINLGILITLMAGSIIGLGTVGCKKLKVR